MYQLVRDRELSPFSERHCRHLLSSNAACVQRMELQQRLEGHAGCVNTVSFDTEGGDLLISGSDDLQIMLWDWERGISRLAFSSGHSNNVFQARMMPHTGGSKIVTCAADGQVRLCEVPQGASTGSVTKSLLGQHYSRAHKLALDPLCPAHCFYSCGEDGVVMHYDLRCSAGVSDEASRQAGGTGAGSSSGNGGGGGRSGGRRKLLACRGYSRSRGPAREVVGINAIHVNSLCPWQFALGCADPWARVYDVRRTRQEAVPDLVGPPTREQARNRMCVLVDDPVCRLCPPHLASGASPGSLIGDPHITCVMYSRQGELLASYNDEDIYLFSAAAAQGASAGSSNGSSGSSGGGVASSSRGRGSNAPQQQQKQPAGAATPSSQQPLPQQPHWPPPPQQHHHHQQQQQQQPPHHGGGSNSPHSSPSRRPRSAAAAAAAAAADGRVEPGGGGGGTDGGSSAVQQQQQQQQQQYNDDAEEDEPPRWKRRQRLDPTSTAAAAARVGSGGGGVCDGQGGGAAGRGHGQGDAGQSHQQPHQQPQAQDKQQQQQQQHDEAGKPTAASSNGNHALPLPADAATLAAAAAAASSAAPLSPPPPAAAAAGGCLAHLPQGLLGYEAVVGAVLYEPDSSSRDGVVASYYGHRNAATVKGVAFFGDDDEYVVSGSDCGHIFMWHKATGAITWWEEGDSEVVNCLEPHPHLPLVMATSGIEHDIKVWGPTAPGPQPPPAAALQRSMSANKRERQSARDAYSEPEHWLLQLLAAQRRRTTAARRRRAAAEAVAAAAANGTEPAAAGGPGSDVAAASAEAAVEDDDEDGPLLLPPGGVRIVWSGMEEQRRRRRGQRQAHGDGDDGGDDDDGALSSSAEEDDEGMGGDDDADGDGDEPPCHIS